MSDEATSKNKGLTMLGLMLALGLIISTLLISGTLKKIKTSDQYITVKGYAEKNIVSDLGSWNGEFSVSSVSLTTAYEKTKSDLNQVIKHLQSMGVPKEKIDVSAVSIIRQYRLNEKGYQTNEVVAYNLIQRINVTLSDVALIERISKESTSLIQGGIEFISFSPQYFFTKLNDLKLVMLGEAAKDARQRADQLAKNSGSAVGYLKAASQGVFQITAPNSTEVSNEGELNTNTVNKTIKAVVTIDYNIK